MAKRTVDIALALIGMLVLCPIYLAVSLALLLSLGCPVLFRQERVGLGERVFALFKFRTMSNAMDREGNLLPDCERLTKVGGILRRTSLDELPQLWNIVRGDMSFVGPRPLLVEYLPYYTNREARRHTVRPGITGLAQVSGRNLLPWDERLEMDVQYVENRSAFLDLTILVKTFWKILRPQDVVEPVGSGDKLSTERQAREGLSADQGMQ